MGRRKDSLGITIKTVSKSIALPDYMVDEITSLIKERRWYSSRADYVRQALYSFNNMVSERMIEICDSNKNKPLEEGMKSITAALKEESDKWFDKYLQYMPEDNGDANPHSDEYWEEKPVKTRLKHSEKYLNSKITVKITEYMLDYMKVMSSRVLKYESVDDYIRVGIVWFIDNDRKELGRMPVVYSIFGDEFRKRYRPGLYKDDNETDDDAD